MPTMDHTGRVPGPSVIATLGPVILLVVGATVIFTSLFVDIAQDRQRYDDRRSAQTEALEAHYDVTITDRPDFNFLGAWTIDGSDYSCAATVTDSADVDNPEPADWRLSCQPDEDLVDFADLNPKDLP